MKRRERPPDARPEPLHAPGAVTTQVDRRVLTGEQCRDRRFRALVEIDGARRDAPRIAGASRAALLVAFTTTHLVPA